MKITAVIPVRAGSQRVKSKSVRDFAGTTLLDNKISVLKTVKEINEIVVNTDSEIALEIAERNNVTGVRREAYYASSNCSGSEFFEHLGKVTETDIFIYAPVTSPFVSGNTISSCIDDFLKMGPDYDCLATVSSVKEFLWLNGSPLNYDPSHAPNSQNLPDVVAINFACSLLSRENLIKNRNIIGKKPKFITIDEVEGLDIDTPLDFFIAEQLYKKRFVNGRVLSTQEIIDSALE